MSAFALYYTLADRIVTNEENWFIIGGTLLRIVLIDWLTDWLTDWLIDRSCPCGWEYLWTATINWPIVLPPIDIWALENNDEMMMMIPAEENSWLVLQRSVANLQQSHLGASTWSERKERILSCKHFVHIYKWYLHAVKSYVGPPALLPTEERRAADCYRP
jgi:hypothetical protein